MTEENYQIYKSILDKLVWFIEDAGFEKIVIHQFSFLDLYFPLYMILVDLKEKLKSTDVKFSDPIENDEKLIEKMMLKEFESFEIKNSNNTLNLGLCEPVIFSRPHLNKYKNYVKPPNRDGHINHCKYNSSDGSFFIHLPFINIPHVYGVALKNRPAINKIKRGKRSEHNQNLNIMNFWNHFATNLSLLDKSDFEDLVVSLYPKGSTTDWVIRTRIGGFAFAGTSWVASVEREFEDLFKGIVDVAFTVQPWSAISASEKHNPPLDIEIVYSHAGDTFEFSSIIFHTLKKEYLVFGDFILNCFSELLKLKINELYTKESRYLDDDIKRYCKLVYEFCDENHLDKSRPCPCCTPEKCSNKNKGLDMTEGCLFETKMAVRLINDSQIYRRSLGVEDDKKNKLAEKEVVADYFVEKFGNTELGIKKFIELVSPPPREDRMIKIEITDFDKKIFNEKENNKYKYRDLILKKMGEIGGYNLSKEITALLGPYDFKPKNPYRNSFRGIFHHIEHNNSFKNDKAKEAAMQRLRDLLKLDPEINKSIAENAFQDYMYRIQSQLSENNGNNEVMIINGFNVKDIFCDAGNKLTISCQACDNTTELSFIIQNDFEDGDRDRLHLPPMIFQNGERFFGVLFQEIIKHSICSQCINTTADNAIKIMGKSIGKKNECLFLLVLEVNTNKPWDIENSDSKELKFPTSLKESFIDAFKLNLYCDYLVLAPLNGSYHICNIGGDDNGFKKANVDYTETVRGDKQLNVTINRTDLQIVNKTDGGLPLKLDTNKTSIFHMFVFDNYQKKPEEKKGLKKPIKKT